MRHFQPDLMLGSAAQVLEVGSVGWAGTQGQGQLLVHTQAGSGFGNASNLMATTLQAAAAAQVIAQAPEQDMLPCA